MVIYVNIMSNLSLILIPNKSIEKEVENLPNMKNYHIIINNRCNIFTKSIILLICFTLIITFFPVFTGIKSYAITKQDAYVTATSGSANSKVYELPSTSSVQVGSTWQQTVKLFWKDGNFYYIEYPLTSGGKKRGYIPIAAIPNPPAGYYTSPPYPEWDSRVSTTQWNTANLPVGGTVVSTVYNNQWVTVLAEEKIGNQWYFYIQYVQSNVNKRGWLVREAISGRGGTPGIISGQRYFIKSAFGKCLDVYNGAGGGTNVVQWPFTGNANQIWTVTHMGNGEYKLTPECHINLNPKKVLDVAGGSPNNWVKLNSYSDNGTEAQRFYIDNFGNGQFRISTKVSEFQRVIEAAGSGEDVIQQIDWMNVGNQKWIFEIVPRLGYEYDYSGNGYYSKNIPVDNISINAPVFESTFDVTINNARAAWNTAVGSYSGANITVNSSSINTIGIDNIMTNIRYVYGAFGYYYPQANNSSGKATHFIIRVNKNKISEAYPSPFNNDHRRNAFTNTVAHEFGHALNLADNPPNINSIMNYSYTKFTSNYIPEFCDLYGAKYSP